MGGLLSALLFLREGFCPPCHFHGMLLSALSFLREGFCPPCYFYGRAFARPIIFTGGLLSALSFLDGRAFVREGFWPSPVKHIYHEKIGYNHNFLTRKVNLTQYRQTKNLKDLSSFMTFIHLMAQLNGQWPAEFGWGLNRKGNCVSMEIVIALDLESIFNLFTVYVTHFTQLTKIITIVSTCLHQL
jgi:hypothetical protein